MTLLLLICSLASQALPPKAAIASAHPLATRAGFEILHQGGNAFDAAVAVSAALAVVEPFGSGLGGGGFWLLHREFDRRLVMLDGRERAPLAASADMYVHAGGKAELVSSINGPLSAGIPGTPAALAHLSRHYGRLPLSMTLAPAIRYAEKGFSVSGHYIKLLGFRLKALQASKAAAAIFLDNGQLPEAGFQLIQKDLAKTLRLMVTNGRAGFYQGPVAKSLVTSVQTSAGIWSMQDLAQYRVVERKPVQSIYKNIRITSAAPPSSGGVVLAEALNILAAYDLSKLDSVARMHLIAEAMRRAYHDRALYLGDPDFIEMPLKRLLSVDYAAGLRSSIRLDRALPSEWLTGVFKAEPGGQNTTHFSILDREGNRVAATLSINYPFGSGFVAEGTGVLLNDEMDDFSSQPGMPNVYGLVGGKANSIEPGKRMLSSMTPTFLEQGDRLAILGTPGGSRIISMVLLAMLDFAEGREPASWVSLPRFHHQYLPDAIQYEPGTLTESDIQGLKGLGHTLKPLGRQYGNMQAILWDGGKQTVQAASDPRGEGLAIVE